MKIRLFAAVLAAVMLMSLLVACDNGKDTTTTTTTTETTTTTTEESATTTTVEEEETTTTTEDNKTAASKKTTTTKKSTTAQTTGGKWGVQTGNKTTAVTTTTKDSVANVTDPTTTVSTTTTKKTQGSRTKTTAPAWEKYFPVQVEGTPAERSLSINNDLKGKQKVKIKSDRATVSMHDCEKYTFNHHPGIALQDGRLFVSFSQAYNDEDSPGQRLVVAHSDDFFNWSEPVVAAPTMENTLVKGKETANMPASLFAWNDTVYYFYSTYSYGPTRFDKYDRFIANGSYDDMTSQSWMVKSTDGGVTWSQPELYISAPGSMPYKSLHGQWICTFGYGIRWMDAGKEPNGLYWSGSGGVSGAQINAANVRLKGQTAHSALTEDAGYQSPDYVYHTMFRSETNYMWHSESYDNGKTWTDPEPSKFYTSWSMWEFGNLPDGRVFAIGSSDPNSRYPLELWISKDGYNFDTCYILRDEVDIAETGGLFLPRSKNQHCPGYAKGGEYGYPHAVMDDEYLYVAYSRHKEMMEITRVKFSDIK